MEKPLSPFQLADEAHWIDFSILQGLTSPGEPKPSSAVLPLPRRASQSSPVGLPRVPVCSSLLSPREGFSLPFPLPKPCFGDLNHV